MFKLIFAYILIFFASQIFAETSQRIVSLNGGITEILFGLEIGNTIVGVDTSSIYPKEATKLPKVGYQRNLSIEGILSLKPSLVIGSSDAGPALIWEELSKLGIKRIQLSSENTEKATYDRIAILGKEFNKSQIAQKIIEQNKKQILEVRNKIPKIQKKLKVLFIYSRGSNLTLVAGKNTSIEEMFNLSGAENAVKEFEGFKPISNESVIKANPDIILIPSLSFKESGGIEEVKKLPGIMLTKAGKENKILHMDDLLLLGFSTRLGEAVITLHELLYKN